MVRDRPRRRSSQDEDDYGGLVEMHTEALVDTICAQIVGAANGEKACFITTRTVNVSITSTWSIAPISLRRKLPLAFR